MPSHKEAEVDVLTDLLVQSMDNNQDIDSYGGLYMRAIWQSNNLTNLSIPVTQAHVSNVVNGLLARILVAQLWNKSIILRVSLAANAK